MEIITKPNGDKTITFTDGVLGEQTMEVFHRDGVPAMIEWDIPLMEDTEHIGLWFEGEKLTDYDGVFEMPARAIELLEALGYNTVYAREDLEECWNCEKIIQTCEAVDGIFCDSGCKSAYRWKSGIK